MFSAVALHFGDYRDIALFHATNSRFKRSQFLGEHSELFPKISAIFPEKKNIVDIKNTTHMVVSKAISFEEGLSIDIARSLLYGQLLSQP